MALCDIIRDIITDQRSERLNGSITDLARNVSTRSQQGPEHALSRRKREMISGGFVIARDKHLASHSRETLESTRFGFTTNKPRKPGDPVIDDLVKRTKDAMVDMRDSHSP